MFARLFAEAGLSLDRLRALVEVGATGSIVRASGGDPVRQSQYSRQIKELEDFFQTRLTERHGKGVRLTRSGKELARISRFFLLGLSNFQRGCLTEAQTFRIGGSATFIDQFLMPALTSPRLAKPKVRYAVESATDDEIERRLHDLTLDFGVVMAETISRPLQLRALGEWRLRLWVPRSLCKSEREAFRAFTEKRLSLAVPARELPGLAAAALQGGEPRISCGTCLEARMAARAATLAVFLPDFIRPEMDRSRFLPVRVPEVDARVFRYHLAWNPRLLRLNVHAVRQRDSLAGELAQTMRNGRA